jgi:site-specific DNA-cytosine methylase
MWISVTSAVRGKQSALITTPATSSGCMSRYGFGYGLAGPNDVARTLFARYNKDGSEILVFHGEIKSPRRLTPRECSRIMKVFFVLNKKVIYYKGSIGFGSVAHWKNLHLMFNLWSIGTKDFGRVWIR